MGNHIIRKGLTLPIEGEPSGTVTEKQAAHVAVMALDFPGVKPRMLVQPGDTVQRGQALFEDKKTPGVFFTAPGAGTVSAVNRGARRALQSVVIALTDTEAAGKPVESDLKAFSSWSDKDVEAFSREEIRDLLVESGMWPAFRTRPFSSRADIDSVPHSIFVTAMDTSPLAPPMDALVKGREKAFATGLAAVAKLTEGPVWLCAGPDSDFIPSELPPSVRVERFSGPHPSGTAGLHIHLLDPVGRDKTVWHIGLQDLLSVGDLLHTGVLCVDRLVSLAGPGAKDPHLIKTRLGADTASLTSDEKKEGEVRVISGSVLTGRNASDDVYGYLGRFHNQISLLPEDREKVFMGWLSPGVNKFSLSRLFLSNLLPKKSYKFTTSTHGSLRAIVAFGLYEQVMPLDILPTYLFRSLAVCDVDQAEKLGCLELDEEDLALCSFVDPGKEDFGSLLRKNLEIIEKEG